MGVPCPANRFLFNGDICDRGEHATEIWALLSGKPGGGSHREETPETTGRNGGGKNGFKNGCDFVWKNDVGSLKFMVDDLIGCRNLVSEMFFCLLVCN